MLNEIGPDYGKGGAIVLRHFDGDDKAVYRPGATITPEEIAKFPPMNRFRLVRSGYIRLVEEKGEELATDVMRLSQDKKTLEEKVEELKGQCNAYKAEIEALRSELHKYAKGELIESPEPKSDDEGEALLGAIHGQNNDEVPAEETSEEQEESDGQNNDEVPSKYDGLDVDQLKELCKQRGMKGYGNSSSEKLIERLIEDDKKDQK